MSFSGEVLVGLVMVVGLAGVVVPVLPGLLLIWGAGLAWVLLDGGGPIRWLVLLLLTGLALTGAAAPYVLPGRSARGSGAPWRTLAAGALGAAVGFFLIPLVGVFVGGGLGIFLAELARLRNRREARTSTIAVLRAMGVGILIELVAGVLMIATWVAGVVLA